MSLADRRKRIEERSSVSGRRESIDSFVSYRNSRFDESDREERISRGDLTQEERKGDGVSSPLSDKDKRALNAVERFSRSFGNTLESALPRDPLKSSAKYLYTDAALKKNEKTIDELGGAGSTAAMRATLAANEAYDRRRDWTNRKIIDEFGSRENYRDYLSRGKVNSITGTTRAERRAQKQALEAELDDINKYLKSRQYGTTPLDDDRALYDPTYEGYLNNEDLTAEAGGGRYYDAQGRDTGRTYEERKEEIEKALAAYGVYDRASDLLITGVENTDSGARRSGWISTAEGNKQITPEELDAYYEITPEDVGKYYKDSAYVRWLVATGQAEAPETVERDREDEAALINSEEFAFEMLDDEEKRALNFVLHSEGTRSANRALKDMAADLSRRNVEYKTNKFREGSEKFWAGPAGDALEAVFDISTGIASPATAIAGKIIKKATGYETDKEARGRIINDAIEPIISMGASLATTPISFLDSLNQRIPDEEGIARVNPYSTYQAPRRWAQESRQRTAEDIDALTGDRKLLGLGLGDVYQAAMSSAESIAGAYTMGPAYSVIMGMGAATDEMNRLAEEGANNGEQAVGGLLAGAAEAVFEHVSLERFANKFINGNPATWRQYIKDVLIQAGVEGSEELVTEIANTLSNKAVMGTQSDWDKAAREYIDRGMSKEDAYRKVWVDKALELWKVTAEGALSGGMMGGAGAASVVQNKMANAAELNEIGADITGANKGRALSKQALDIAASGNVDAKTAKALEKAAEAYDKKNDNKRAGKLFRAVTDAVNEGITDAEAQGTAAGKVAAALLGNGVDYVKASDPVSGDAVTVDRAAPIARTEDGNVYMNTDRGEVALEDLAFEDDAVRDMIYSVSEYGPEYANMVLTNYGGEDVGTYLGGMREGILTGQYGDLGEELYDFNSLSRADQNLALKIGQAIRADQVAARAEAAKAARLRELNVRGRDLTKQDMKIEGVKAGRGASGRVGQLYFDQGVKVESDLDRANADFAKLVSVVYGNDIVIFDSEQNPELRNKNGMHVGSDGSIWVDIKAGEARQGLVAYALSHEMTHEAAQWAPEAYRAFTDFLTKNYAEQGVSVRELVNKKMGEMGTDNFDAAFDEVIADACERFLLDSNAIEKLNEMRKTDRTTFEKIRDFIKSAIAKLKAALQSLKTAGRLEGTEASEAFRNSATGEQIEELEKKIKQLEDAWSMVLVEAAENRAKASGETEFGMRNAESKTDVKYSERLTKDDYARYMELAKDPEKNEAELSRMVEAAARAGDYDYHLFHGTNADFTKFDIRKFGGKNGKGEGYGIYLAANKEIAGPYGKNLIDSYVKFQRLAEGSKRTLTSAEVRKLIKTSCEAEANRSVEDGEYESFEEAIKDSWVSNYVYTYEYGDMNRVYADVAEKILQGNSNDGDIINEIMIAAGAHYNYDAALDFYDNVLTPVTGIDGFHYIWGAETENANDIYLAFHSEQIKKADPVVYDDQGNVIPLEDRFRDDRTGDDAWKNEDIRYSERRGEEPKQTIKGGTVYAHRVLLNEDTIDKYLKDYASKSTPRYAQAYITFIRPTDYIELTTTKAGRDIISKQTADLDTEQLAKASVYQPMFLNINHKTGKVEGHEGRHRMTALMRSGVGQVPVLLFDSSNKYDKAPIDELYLKAQDFNGRRNYGGGLVYNVMPLNYENRDNIVKAFSEKPRTEEFADRYNNRETIRYSTRTGVSTSTRAVVERALETLKDGPEKTALTAYKRVLDQIDKTIAEYSDARKNRDAAAAAEAQKQLNTLQARARKMETAPAMQNVAAMQDVAALNEDVRNLSRLLKLQSTETGGAIAMKSSLERAASDLMKEHGVKRGKAELVELLNNFYTDMTREVSAQTLNREYMVAAAQPIAEWLVDNAPNQVEIDTEINDVLKYIKGSKIRVNDQQRGDIENKYESFEKWRKSLFPYVTVTTDPSATTLDSFWADLAAQYPDYFDANLSWADQGVELSGVISNLKSGRVTEYYLSPEARSWLIEAAANDVAEAFWRIKPYETVADKYAKEIRRLKEDHRAFRNIDEYIQDQKQAAYDLGYSRAKLQQVRSEYRRRIRSLTENMSNRLIKPKVNKYIPESLQAATAEVLKAINLDSGRSKSFSEKLGQLREQYQKIIDREKAAQGIGEDQNGRYPITTEDQVVEDTLKLVEERVKNVPISEMSSVQLEAVYTALKMFDHVVRDRVNAESMNTLLDKKMTVQDIGERLIEESEETKERRGAISRYFNWQMRPEEFFETLAGYKKNSMWHRVYQMLDNAQRQQIFYEMQGNEIFRDVLKDQKYVRSLSAHKDGDLVDIGLKDAKENPYKITRGMMLSIWKHLQNEENMRHIMIGGLVAPDLKKYYDGKTENVYNEKENRIFGVIGAELASAYKRIESKISDLDDKWEAAKIRGDGETMDAVAAERDAAWAERDDIVERGRAIMDQIRKNIEALLTEQDRAFLAASDKFFDEFSRGILNDATRRMYGFEKAKVENYFPIHVSSAFLGANFESIKRDFSVEGSGFMKDRVQSSKPIMLEDFGAVIDRQISNVAKYAALAPALKDFSKIYSVIRGGAEFETSVGKTISERFGDQGVKYLEDLIADLNGARSREASIFDRLRSRGAGAVLTLNPRVSMVQAASYVTAASELGYGPLARALLNPEGHAVIGKRAPTELIKKYSGMLWTRKEKGNIDAAVAATRSLGNKRTLAESKLKFLTGWIEAVDAGTVGRLWYASEYYVQKKNPDMKRYKTSGDQKKIDQYYMKVADVFSNVIERTQPNYTVMQRPAVLRSTNAMTKALTMFMTQRLQNANILYSATRRWAKYSADYKAGINGVTREDVREARAGFVNAVTSQMISAATISAMRLVADMLLRNMKGRRDEDGEITGESIGWSLLNDFLSSAVSNFVGGSETYEAIRTALSGGKYYGISAGGLDQVNDFVSDTVNVLKNVAKGEFKPKELTSIGTDIGTLFGIPAGNAYKIAKAIKGWGEAFGNETKAKGNLFDYGTGEIWESGPIERTKKQKGNLMLKAYQEGNKERYREIQGQFADRGKADEALLDTVYEEWAAGDLSDGDALKILEDCLSSDKAPDTENKKRIQIEKWENKKANAELPEEERTSYGVYNDLKGALRAYVFPEAGADRVTAGRKAQAMIEQYREWGYDDTQIRDAIRNTFKNEYVAMAEGQDKDAARDYIAKLYTFTKDSKGKDYKDKDAKKLIDKWKATEEETEEETEDEREWG